MTDQGTAADTTEGTSEISSFTTPPLTSDRIRQFSLAMRDSNPVHLDDAFCRSVGLPGVIAPGGMGVVAIAHTAARWFGWDAIREIDVTFRSPMAVDEALRCSAEVVGREGEIIEVFCRAQGPDGTIRAEGRLKVVAP